MEMVKQDFATANYNANTVSVRFGTGTGSFNTSPVINVGSKPQALAAGDFNGDGKKNMILLRQTAIAIHCLC